MTLPAEPLSLEHQDTSWMNNTAAPLRAVHVGPRSLTAQQVWARGWGRPWDTGRAIMQSLGGTKVGFQLGIVRVAGSVQWRESVVVDPAGNVVYASAPDRMLGADAIEVSTGGALSLPAPTARIESCLTGMVLREDGWQVTHAKAEGTRIERLAAGPVSLSALMPALDDREATPRRGRMWTGLPRQFVWTLELPGVVLHQVPVSGGGKGPSTEWSAQCTSDASGSMCDVSFQHDGGWLEPGSVPGLQLVHDAVSEWASQAIEVAR